MGGMRPVAEILTINFALLAMAQIVNHAAKFHYMFGGKIRVPMVMRTVSGWGQLGATHSQTFENWFSSVPGLKVVAPATPRDAKGLLKASIEDDDPVIFIEHSLLYGIKGEVPDNDFREPLGRALVVREGTDVTIVGYSRMLQVALRAAAQLEEQGVSAEVIDLRTLRPLDMDTIYESVRKTHRLVMCEEDWRTVGIGAEIAASGSEQCLDALDAPGRRAGGVPGAPGGETGEGPPGAPQKRAPGPAAPAPAPPPAPAAAAAPATTPPPAPAAAAPPPPAAPKPAAAPPAPTAPAAMPALEYAEGERPHASPLARRIAERFGIDLRQVSGSGPGAP